MKTLYYTGIPDQNRSLFSTEYNYALNFATVGSAAEHVLTLDPGVDGDVIAITPDASGMWLIVKCVSEMPIFLRRQAGDAMHYLEQQA
jgi:hypothetical protein